MSDFNYTEISFNESKNIEKTYEHVRTIFYGEDTTYKIFSLKDGTEIELKYEYSYDKENNENCVVYKKIK